MDHVVDTSPRRIRTLDGYLGALGRLWLYPALFVALATSAFAIHRLHLQQSAAVQTAAERLASTIDADLLRRVQGLQALVVSAASSTDTSLSEWHRGLRSYEQSFDTAVALVDSEPKTLLSSRLSVEAIAPPLPEPVRRLLTDASTRDSRYLIGDLVNGAVVQEPLVPIAVWVDAKRERAVVGAVLTHKLEKVASRAGLPQEWSATVLDRNGRSVASIGERQAPMDDWSETIRSASTRMTEVPWTITVTADARWFFFPHAFALLTFLAASGLAAMVTRVATRKPTRRLVEGLRRIPQRHQTQPEVAEELDSVMSIEEIKDLRSELARLAQEGREAEVAERQRIARDLHDGLQQRIAVTQLDLSMALRDAQSDKERQASIERARQSLHDVSRELRQVIKALRPMDLEGLGLREALAGLVEQFQYASGVQVEHEVIGGGDSLDAIGAIQADAIYRIVQESLNNVRKHAQASFVHLFVDVNDPSKLVLSVSDDGVGLPEPTHSTGHGLRGMAERAQALGANLDIRRGHDADATRGTTVTLTVPMGKAASDRPEPASGSDQLLNS